jgi:hypothetical protein
MALPLKATSDCFHAVEMNGLSVSSERVFAFVSKEVGYIDAALVYLVISSAHIAAFVASCELVSGRPNTAMIPSPSNCL